MTALWQRDATRDLATGRTGDAIHAYDRHDMVHSAETREQTRGDLIDRWDRQRQASPDSSRIILTQPGDDAPERDTGQQPERGRAGTEASPAPDMPEREEAGRQMGHDTADDPEEDLRKVRTKALIRHARAVDAIFEVKGQGLTPSEEQRRELGGARRAFEEVRPFGWRDAEAAYSKDNSLATEAGGGVTGRAVRALYQETELRMERDELAQRADRFVERWQKLDRAAEQRYADGDYSGHKAARKEMGNMAMSLERDAQMDSLLRGRKRELGIDFDSGHSLGRDLAISHGLGKDRGIGL